MVDSKQTNIDKAKKLGLEAFSANIYSDNLADNIELSDVGYLIAMTANQDINNYAIETFREQFGENGSFRIVGSDEIEGVENQDTRNLFSTTDDFVRFMEAARLNPAIREMDLRDQAHFDQVSERAKTDEGMVPLFLKSPDGELHIIPSFLRESGAITEGYKLVYLGKPLSGEREDDEQVRLAAETP